MNWEQLREQAQAIVENSPSGEFTDITFRTNSGPLGINKNTGVSAIHQSHEFRYDTIRNGKAFRRTITVRCRDTGAKDMDNLNIYEDESGNCFVFKYGAGSPDWFDWGSIQEPRFDLPANPA